MSDERSVQSVAQLTVPKILISTDEKYFECLIEINKYITHEVPKDGNFRNNRKL